LADALEFLTPEILYFVEGFDKLFGFREHQQQFAMAIVGKETF
jgi:hypothetical protein